MIRSLALLAVFGFVVPAAANDSKPASKPVAHKLPAKGDVIVYDSRGGFTPRPLNNDPVMAIKADGTVVLGNRFSNDPPVKGKITKKELAALVSFALDTNQLGKYDPKSVQAQIKASGKFIGIADAGSIVVKINADGKEYSATQYALPFMARQFPKIKELQQLNAVAGKLRVIRNTILAGGKEGVAKALKLVNAELKKKFPKTPALKTDELASAYKGRDGTLRVSFSRQPKVQGKDAYVSGSASFPAKGEASARVNVFTPRPRPNVRPLPLPVKPGKPILRPLPPPGALPVKPVAPPKPAVLRPAVQPQPGLFPAVLPKKK